MHLTLTLCQVYSQNTWQYFAVIQGGIIFFQIKIKNALHDEFLHDKLSKVIFH